MENRIGENISVSLQADGKLILTIDTSKNIGLSKSGKMMGVANTSGFTAIPGTDLQLNLWLGKKV